MVDVIKDMSTAIMIIDFMLAPNQIIIMGPNDILGRLLKIVKKGSNILAVLLDNHSSDAIIIPSIVVNKKAIMLS